MILSDISIRRPVLATVMSLMLVLLGVIAFDRLTVREYPDIDAPQVSVRVVYPGASASVIESQVTEPLEDALAGIEGVETIKSASREQVAQITLTFLVTRDLDEAASDVRDRVARIRGRLPPDAEAPVVAKAEADAQAILWLGLSSDSLDPLALTDYAERNIVDALKTLPGVSSVTVSGARRYAMRIWLDRDRMAALGVTVGDIEAALERQNVELPAGRIESRAREFTVQADTGLTSATAFGQIVIRSERGYPLRLADVGRVELGAEDDRNSVRVDGRQAVGMGVVKQSTANTLEVARAVKALLPQLQKNLPAGTRLSIGYDSSIFIERSIAAVYKVLAEAFLFVTLVIFVFLRGVRATLVPVVTIPVSLIGAFIFLYALGFSINTLSLLGLVLAVGLVVDDAIVMLENIHRHVEAGMPPHQAARIGSKEIGFAVLAMTVTLVAVFLPLGFLEGKIGRLFTEFALTVAAAVLVSGFVALTLSPMMCSRWLKPHTGHGLYERTERIFVAMNDAYRRQLHWLLAHRWAPVLLFVVAGIAGWFFFAGLKSELAPAEDRGAVIVSVTAPEGSTMAYTDAYMRELEKILLKTPEVDAAFVITAPGLERPNDVTRGVAFSQLAPWEERERSQQDIIESLRAPLAQQLPGVRAFPLPRQPFNQGRTTPVQFVVQANTYADLQQAVDQIVQAARDNPGLDNVDSDLKLDTPQLNLRVDRERAADLGIEVETVGRTLEALLGGKQITRFVREGKQYDVIVQLDPAGRDRPEDIDALYVRGGNGTLHPLANLVGVEEVVAAKTLNHFNRKRAATINANLKPDYTLGEALTFMEATAAAVKLPITADLDGQSREFRQSGAELWLTFGLALAFIYLVLSAQFESFRHSVLIMLTVPLAIAGALATLLFTGNSLNVYSQIGLVMLVGLITKHGILIVEFANQLRAQGQDRVVAVTEAAVLRLRPILMTTAATILGALPLALSAGAGAEARAAIGWVVVGGMTFGTLLTLFVIPGVYALLAGARHAAPDELC